MKLTLTNHVKAKWFRPISVLATLLFLFNTNLAFCACLAGEPVSAQETDKPVQEKNCHCSRPMADTAQHPGGSSDPHADTCPLCHCDFTEHSGHSEQGLAAPAGAPSGIPVAAAATENPSIYVLEERRLGSDPPLRFVRPQILYLLHRTFLN